MHDDPRQPAIIVRTSQDDYRRSRVGGGKAKPHGDIDEARARLLDECEAIKTRLYETASGLGAAIGIARLKLKTSAIAKSHRPREAFTIETCPIIGDQEGPGELLVLVSPPRLEKLERRIRRLGHRGAVHLTSIESMTLASLERRFPDSAREEVRAELSRSGEAMLKLRMPTFHLFSDSDRVELEVQIRNTLGVDSKPYFDYGNFALYAVSVRDMELAMAIASWQFIDRLDLMPSYAVSGELLIDVAGIRIAGDVPLDELPIVGIVDTGIADTCPLNRLVWARERLVPQADYDPSHGTAVAAIVAAPHGTVREDFEPRARFLDLAILPAKGGIPEHRLIEHIQDALDRYSSDVKIWNLSLAKSPGLQPAEFSDLAKALDNFHKLYNVQFYCAAGNCTAPNWRSWPPAAAVGKSEWVAAPGDAVCAVTVGACVPQNAPDEVLAPKLAPAPYSPRGPVAYGVQKPDIAIPSGTFTASRKPFGPPTMLPSGDLSTEMVGTSFSTPVATGVGAELLACVESSGLPIGQQLLAAKALMLHHAQIPAVFGSGGAFRFSDYYGYGIPVPFADMIEDPFWRSTSLIFAELYPLTGDLVIADFPYPDGLHQDRRYRGRLLLTMVSEPILDPNFRVEYARSNVDVHFGVVDRAANGRMELRGQAKGVRGPTGYETDLIREERKWSPIKQYRSDGEVNCTGDYWQLTAQLLLRDQEADRIRRDPTMAVDYRVDVVIAVTIEDPSHTVRVNDQMVVKWRERGFIAESVQIAPRIRARSGYPTSAE